MVMKGIRGFSTSVSGRDYVLHLRAGEGKTFCGRVAALGLCCGLRAPGLRACAPAA